MLTEDKNLTRAILAVFNTQPGIRLAILFCSLAAGRERADSDLDLAVDAGHRLTAGEKLALVTELAERTGRSVDLVDLHAVGEPLLGQILRHGNRLLGSDTCYADLIRKHLFDQADYLPYRNRILAERRRVWIGK
jgi:predicted nucleotidyltransferase